jgi:hypothetical protein
LPDLLAEFTWIFKNIFNFFCLFMYFYGTLCCPRVAQVLEVFYRRVEEGIYPPLPPRSSVDWALLVQVFLQYTGTVY